jgi:glycosyltransferase involved in cell wall biosynthesis
MGARATTTSPRSSSASRSAEGAIGRSSEAATRLRDTRLRWIFCGAGSLDAALRADATARGIPVRFTGFRPDVARCLAASDVAVLPSLHEGLGVAALEAMAAGRPVVASRVGGLAEVVVDGETGALVPPRDADALAAALRTLAAAPETRMRLGTAAARARARALFGRRHGGGDVGLLRGAAMNGPIRAASS